MHPDACECFQCQPVSLLRYLWCRLSCTVNYPKFFADLGSLWGSLHNSNNNVSATHGISTTGRASCFSLLSHYYKAALHTQVSQPAHAPAKKDLVERIPSPQEHHVPSSVVYPISKLRKPRIGGIERKKKNHVHHHWRFHCWRHCCMRCSNRDPSIRDGQDQTTTTRRATGKGCCCQEIYRCLPRCWCHCQKRRSPRDISRTRMRLCLSNSPKWLSTWFL